MAWERELNRRSMESPGVLFFRVLVMLACLILVPLAAIFGSAFPELVKTTLVDRIKEFAGLEVAPTKSSPTRPAIEAPAYQPQTAATQAHAESAAPAWNSQAPSNPQASAEFATPAGGANAGNSTAVTTAENWEPAPRPAQAASPPPSNSQPPAAAPVDHFTAIQHRLRDYGATRYALETSGDRGELYHFFCEMPAGNGNQHFEATDRNALQAMADVLAQVETWRAKGPQSTLNNYRR